MKKQEHSFFEAVWEVVALIPYGKVSSYGAIASYLSTPKAARMVGWAMNASHAAKINIPAHRVVNRLGVLSGKSHFGQIDLMENLLRNEGLIISNDKIVNFEQNFWDPNKELV
ncbi:MAG: MGMT family protein [Bacteroidales bacterium]|nr:MGMT family protein [Bacteroidales bacterium]